MRYQPVVVSELFTVSFPKGYPQRPRMHDVLNDVDRGVLRKSKVYFEARSKSVGNCGHKHKTRESAEPCRVRLMQVWSKRRSEQSRAAAAKRRAAAV